MDWITTSVGGTDGIVWHVLIATSKRMVGILMVEYGIFNFATDAVYLGAIMVQICLGVAVIAMCFSLMLLH